MNSPAERNENELILEGIVSSINADGSTNLSPMGPVTDRAVNALRLRPFKTSTTYANLRRTKRGVFHITDDVVLLAKTAIGSEVDPPLHPVEDFEGYFLRTCCRWYAFEVESMDDTNDRVEICCKVVKHGRLRDFVGWNRAMYAVLEAAILATRIGFLPRETIQTDFDKLAVIVSKTASERERDAFQILVDYLESHSP